LCREKIEIDKLNAENYLQQFVHSLERNTDILSSDDAVKNASKSVFGLYNKLRIMDQRFAQMTPGFVDDYLMLTD
jgi:(p)ppGpp synthase/HD superfamily hydrolase